MKNINEKAEEYTSVIENQVTNNAAFLAYKAGANYVLEEIERIVNSAIENKSMTIPTWRLNYIIKQLKK